MFKRHYKKRSPNIAFVFFRLLLSLTMFVVLLGGIYSAYKYFSGLDPLKLDPQAIISNVILTRTPKQLLGLLPNSKQILGKSIPTPIPTPTNSAALFKFLLVADSHTDNADLDKALKEAIQKFPDLKFIIGLGDYSDVGTIDELKNAKKVFDSSSLRYFVIPGDHDLWDSRNRSLPPVSYFSQVFGPPYQSFTFDNFSFLLLDNSDNYAGFDDKQLKWVTDELEKIKQAKPKGIFVFSHEPLYHPSSDHVMGWVENSLKAQAGGLLFQLKDAQVSKIFAGDIHFFSEYSEPKTNLPMVTIGAVTSDRNPQAPRFGIVSVFDDGTTKVEDVIILGI